MFFDRQVLQDTTDRLSERIFAALGMHETGFHVAPAHRARLATVYTPTADGLRADTRPELAYT